MNSAGGRQEECASDATEWVNSGTTSGQMRLSEYRLRQAAPSFLVGMGLRDEDVRDLAIKFTSFGHYLASREWANVLTDPSAGIGRTSIPCWCCAMPSASTSGSRLGRPHRCINT